jgi:hypothetical protein
MTWATLSIDRRFCGPPDARDDRDAGSLGALVQVVERAEYLQLVSDVEVVHSSARRQASASATAVCRNGPAAFSTRSTSASAACSTAGSSKIRARCGRWRRSASAAMAGAAAREQGPVAVRSCVLGDQGAGGAGGTVEHPRACPAPGGCPLAVEGGVLSHPWLTRQHPRGRHHLPDPGNSRSGSPERASRRRK